MTTSGRSPGSVRQKVVNVALLTATFLAGLLGGFAWLLGFMFEVREYGRGLRPAGVWLADEDIRNLTMPVIVVLGVAAVVVVARQRRYRHPTRVLLCIAGLQLVATVFMYSLF